MSRADAMRRHPAGKSIPESPEVRQTRQNAEAVSAANGTLWDQPPAWRTHARRAIHICLAAGAWWVLFSGMQLTVHALSGGLS